MDQYEFRRELDAVLPSPDPRLAKRLIDFAEENKIYFSETEYKVVFYEEYLASLRFVAKNFGQDTLASIPRMIDEQNMILPDEMVAAAICVQGGVPVDQVQQMAYHRRALPYGPHQPPRAARLCRGRSDAHQWSDQLRRCARSAAPVGR